jgi:hypothetical protein
LVREDGEPDRNAVIGQKINFGETNEGPSKS